MAELYNSSVVGKLDLAEGNILEVSGAELSISSYNAAQIHIEEDVEQTPAEEQPAAEYVDGLVVPSGKYLIGTEIPEGTCRIVCEEAYGMATISIFNSEKVTFPSYTTLLAPLMGNAEIGKIELNKGDYFEVSDGSVTLYTYTGLVG